MADFFILLPARTGETALFAWRSGGDWAFASERPVGRFGKGEGAVAFVPPTAVITHRTDIVARKPPEARRTALFAIEDDVAEPVEVLHVALGPAGEGRARTVQLVGEREMAGWLDYLDGEGLPDADLVAPQSVLPDDNMAVEGPDVFLFAAGHVRLAVDSDAPDDLVRSVAPEGERPIHSQRLARILGATPAGDAITDREAWLVRLATWYQAAAASSVTLRQGAYAVRSKFQLEGLPRWRAAGALAAMALLLWGGSIWLETAALNNQSTELRTRTNAVIANVAPEAQGNIAAAIETLRQSQRAAGSGVRPIPASAALYEAIAPVGNAEIQSLRYDASNGRLVAQVVFDNYSQADTIGERLEASGLSVTLGDARQSGDRVLGEFVIEGAA